MTTLFCPKIGGKCIKEKCISYSEKVMIELKNGGTFIRKVMHKEIDYNSPLIFSISVGVCSEYDKIIDKESADLIERFQKDIDEVKGSL